MSQGVPSRYVLCPCGSEEGLPREGRCRRCINRGLFQRYVFTPEMDARIAEGWNLCGRKQELVATISRLAGEFNMPRHVVTTRAAKLGLARRRVRWTQEASDFLRANAGILSIAEISRALGRTDACVKMYATRMKLRLRCWKGYDRKSVATLFGVSVNTVDAWQRRGWLKKDTTGVFTQPAMERLLREHLDEIELRQADQDWLRETLKGMLATAPVSDPRAYDEAATGRVKSPERYLPTGYEGLLANEAYAKREQRSRMAA